MFEELFRNFLLSLLAISMNTVMPIINKIDIFYKIRHLETRVDRKIPVKVYFIVPYLAYFPYLVGGWAYLGLSRFDYFEQFVFSMGFLGLAAGFINLIFPTYAPRAYIYGSNIFSRLIRWHYGLNRPLTAFPSLHVAHSVCLSIFFVIALPQLSLFWIFLPVAIALSTLFTKEHYLPDVVGGVILGLGIPFIIGYLMN
jgi:hypothetical protein